MSRDLTKTQALFKEGAQYIPNGVNSNFRYWDEEDTLVVTKGEGGPGKHDPRFLCDTIAHLLFQLFIKGFKDFKKNGFFSIK